MKSPTRPLRLGSFEQLESRAMLAHGGMNFAEMSFTAVNFGPETFGPMRFVDQGPGQFYSAHDFHSKPQSFTTGEMEPRGEQRMQNERNYEPRGSFDSYDRGYELGSSAISAAPVFVVIPVTQVIVFINIPAPSVSQTQYSPPLSSNNDNNVGGGTPSSALFSPNSNSNRSQLAVSPPASFGNSLVSANAPPRSSSIAPRGLDSLSIATSLTLKRTDSDNSAADETEATPADSDNETTTHDSRERDSAATIRPQDPAAATPTNSDDDAELIELNAEDPLARGKRRVTRKANSTQSDSATIANASLRLQQQLAAPQLRQQEIWLQAAPTETDFSPVADDLIELLANESSETAQPATRANSFENQVVTIKATLGYFRASESELKPNAAPENAQSAAVAAAALPVPAGK